MVRRTGREAGRRAGAGGALAMDSTLLLREVRLAVKVLRADAAEPAARLGR
jgi:hypothetical protein